MWGLDLSGSEQGAGGVGGLLAVKTYNPQTTTFVVSDANGNVTTLVEASDGTKTAEYEYSPFGIVLKQTGPQANTNPFRFSNKYHDAETGLVYYGYRYYNPETGRWINRDPIGEKGGENIYGFASNNALSFFDILGMRDFTLTIYHNMTDRVLTETSRNEVQRIYQDCLKKCDKCGKHTITVKFVKTDKNHSELEKEGNLGQLGENFWGFYPMGYGTFIEDLPGLFFPGCNAPGSTDGGINTRLIQDMVPQLYDLGVSTAIAHETGLHSIAGKYDYIWNPPDPFDIDHPKPKINPARPGVFSDKTCNAICDKLDLDT
jgi:RHS repeat-associated protein